MKIFELKLSLFLKEDISYKNSHEFLTKNINKSFLNDEILKDLHINKTYKPYSFGNLYPYNKETKIYEKNQVFVLNIRSCDEMFLKSLKRALENAKNLDFKVLTSEFKEFKITHIDSVFTATPAIISVLKNDKILCWTAENGVDFDFLKKRITDNLEKKYFEFSGEKVKAPADFITLIELQNKKPIIFNYKKGKLLANKFKLFINSDEISQKLIKFAFGVGILEKNSLGFGFIKRG